MRWVGPLEIQICARVHVRGALHTVVNMWTIDGGTGRLLTLDDRSTYRLRTGDTLPAEDP